MRRLTGLILAAGLAVGAQAAWADDLTGVERLLCAAVETTACFDDGECVSDAPWNLNIPGFIEVDLKAGQLATTRASGQNRVTPIENLARRDGSIVFHGFENDRAFSWMIDEKTGQATVVVASDGMAVAVFGSCTPRSAGDGERLQGSQP